MLEAFFLFSRPLLSVTLFEKQKGRFRDLHLMRNFTLYTVKSAAGSAQCWNEVPSRSVQQQPNGWASGSSRCFWSFFFFFIGIFFARHTKFWLEKFLLSTHKIISRAPSPRPSFSRRRRLVTHSRPGSVRVVPLPRTLERQKGVYVELFHIINQF